MGAPWLQSWAGGLLLLDGEVGGWADERRVWSGSGRGEGGDRASSSVVQLMRLEEAAPGHIIHIVRCVEGLVGQGKRVMSHTTCVFLEVP